MQKLSDFIFKLLLTVRYTAVPKRLIKRDFSKSALKLMIKAGIHPEEGDYLTEVRCLEFNKRVFKLSMFELVIRYVCPEWDTLTFFQKKNLVFKQFYRFDVFLDQESTNGWDLFIYRDKESVKLTLFNYSKREKKVYWSNYSNFKNEIDFTNTLAEFKVSVVPFSTTDASHQLVTQALLNTKTTNTSAIILSLSDLTSYYRNSAKLENYESHIDYFRTELLNLSPEFFENLQSLGPNYVSTVPITQVHGDLSPSNILWNGVNYYLIDFDRTFNASVYYDLIHLYLQSIPELKDAVIEHITDIFEEFNPNIELGQIQILKLALELFIIDNYRYLELAPSEKKFSHYTQKLIQDGFRAWKNLR